MAGEYPIPKRLTVALLALVAVVALTALAVRDARLSHVQAQGRGSGPQDGRPIGPDLSAQAGFTVCPPPGGWAMSVWTGPNNTPTGQAIASCTNITVTAVFYFDYLSQTWQFFIAGAPEAINTFRTINNLQAVFLQGGEARMPAPTPTPTPTPTPLPLQLRSDAFAPGGAIPVRYTCDQADVSPPLAWSGGPANVASFALIVDDPDAVPVAGFVWTHWVLFNLPASVSSLPEDVPGTDTLANGGVQGRNDFGMIGYDGPCPPMGNPSHHYNFTLYALDATLNLAAGAAKQQVLDAMQGHILTSATLTGTYQR